MFWLGLLLSVCYVPGYTGASIPTQWAVLSILLPACLWRIGPVTLGHKLFLAFVLYASLATLWSLNSFTAIWGLWLVFIWGLSYHFGTIVGSLRGLWQGLAVGLSASAVLAVLQAGFDFTAVATDDPLRPAGLFYNSSLLGVICGLVLIALVCHRLWWFIPAPALALLLSGSRGGLAILGVGLTARFGGALAAAVVVTAGMTAFAFGVDPSDLQRMQIWGVALRAINAIGHGPGSFLDLYYVREINIALIHPEYVHNDVLQLLYEYGLGALPLLAIPALALGNTRHRDWPVLVGFTVAAGFYFPLYTPLTSFLGLAVAGNSLRRWPRVRRDSVDWRPSFLSRLAPGRSIPDLDGGQAVPLVARATHED